MSECVAVAMSGGVDSAVAAARLVDAGGRVIGVTARMTEATSRCCAPEDIERAATVAAALGIAHHVVDVVAPFRRHVIDAFAAEYCRGRTPSPCVVCNRTIKFGALMEAAAGLGADALATGHYARTAHGPPALLRGTDRTKDQSYFLARLTPEQLARSRFPLGASHKRDVQREAAERDLPCRESRESQELCFVTGDINHGTWIDVHTMETCPPGDIVDPDGRILGRHAGIHHFTVGQRKGLGIATGYPAYVVRIDAPSATVVVGPREAAMGDAFTATDTTWLAPAPRVDEPVQALAQIRYNHRAAPCRITRRGDDRVSVRLAEPEFALAPGQLAAFYDDDRVLGAGWISLDE